MIPLCIYTNACIEIYIISKFYFADVFQKQPLEFELTIACIADLNTVVRNGIHCPIIYGIGVNVKTGELFPATFPDKGPEQNLRTARNLSTSQQVSIMLCKNILIDNFSGFKILKTI